MIILLFIYFLIFYRVPILGLHYEGEILCLLIFLFRLDISARVFRDKIHSVLQLVNFVHFCIAILWIVISQGDIEYIYPVVRNFFSITAAFWICCACSQRVETVHIPFFMLIGQVLSIYSCIVFYDICAPAQYFMHGEAYNRLMQDYSGQRGFSLASSLAFGLANSMSVLIVFYSYIFGRDSSSYKGTYGVFFLVTIPALFSVARITVFAYLLSFGFILMFSARKMNFIASLAVTGVICTLSFLYFYEEIARFVEFGFELFINIYRHGAFSTSSSTKLIEDMLYFINGETLWVGTGQYYNNDGSYYGESDSGYVRPILFFGIFVFVLSLFTHIYILYIYFVKRYKMQFLFFSFLTLSLILQLKGDTIGYSVDFVSAIALTIASIEYSKKLRRI